ncbi:MAG: hydrogenase iron-sulfur subunit [Chitinivibrionales bacterium]|nr:hydrogenase iron-sulfur subunit [Chitinivibrionales bacterium]
MDNFNPVIVAFVCNWCSYSGADKAGGQKLDYPANVKLIRVMCSGRVDPQFVMQAFREGADGVMVLGCHPGDCHYRSGNIKTLRRFALFEKMLAQLGIESGRFKLDWVAAGESKRFQEVATQMTETVKKLGSLSIRGYVESEAA